jgi:hypothetical protein
MTKTERRNKAKRTAAKRNKATAIRDFLKKLSPGRKFAGARLRKNPGGSITIIPVKLKAKR